MSLKEWYLEREVSKLKEEVQYWRGHYNRTMNFLLEATMNIAQLKTRISNLQKKHRVRKRRKHGR